MTFDPLAESAQSLWRNQPPLAQPPGPHNPPSAELHHKVTRFQGRVFWRNIREYIAAALGAAIYAYFAWKFSPMLMRVGAMLVVAGILFVVYQLHRRGSGKLAYSDPSHSACLDFYRSELERQRDALRSVWSWYLLPLVPGMTVFSLGTSIQGAGKPTHWEHAALSFVITSGAMLLAFAIVARVNRVGAAKLQTQIDELAKLQHDPDSSHSE